MATQNESRRGLTRQALNRLYDFWQEPRFADRALNCALELDHGTIPLSLFPPLNRTAALLFLEPLNLWEAALSAAEGSIRCTADTEPEVSPTGTDPLAGWPEKPRLVSLQEPLKCSPAELVDWLQTSPVFSGCRITARYHRCRRMEPYRGAPESLMTLVAVDPQRHIMVGFDRMTPYLVIWAPENVAIPDSGFLPRL